MRDFLRYDHFDGLEAPVAAISKDGEIVYRNDAALRLSRRFSYGGNLLAWIDGGSARLDECFRKRHVSLVTLSLDNREHSALIVPDRSPEGMQAILLLAPLLEGELCYQPSRTGPTSDAAVEGVAPLPDAGELSRLGQTLVRAYAKLPLCYAQPDPSRQSVTIGAMILFLNRLFERAFDGREPNATAVCTNDCTDFPLSDFEPLSACLAYLSVLTAVNARGRELKVTFFSEMERPHILFAFESVGETKTSLAGLFPARRVEFTLLEALLDTLRYDLRVYCRGSVQYIELTGRERFRLYRFRTYDGSVALREQLMVEDLLTDLGLPADPDRKN